MQFNISEQSYKEQLAQKLKDLHQSIELSCLQTPETEVFDSPISEFRMRAEFRIWHEGDDSFYAMHHPKTKEIFTLDDFPIASAGIRKRMPILIKAINESDDILSRKLFQVEFLSTTTDEMLISLIYHRPLGDEWSERAKKLESELDAHIIGRSRKQKVVLTQDFVTETMQVSGTNYQYQQVENSFTQPNAVVCQKMLTWAQDKAKKLSDDLLELYCGNGNFTLPLSKQFENVLATEVSKTSVRSAHYNIEKNNIQNVTMARLSSEETTQALNKEREFRRLKDINLDDYNFSTVFVDPPRAGLDEQTLELVKRFDNIIYISCNPNTFIENAKALEADYTITDFAAFDQFPYTHHLEVGAILTKKSKLSA